MSVLILRPNANGDLIQFDPFPAGNANWEMVDEITPDDGSTVNMYGAPIETPGEATDLYNLPNPSQTGVITSVKVYSRIDRSAQAVEIGTAYILVKIGGTIYLSSGITLPQNFATYNYEWTTNPNTNSAWTWADINNLQIGLKVSIDADKDARITQTYVEITYSNPPTVTTQAVTDILSTTATGNGNITDTGGENATKRGFCWNTTGSPTVSDNIVEEEGSFGTGAFTGAITGLFPGVTYYVKAYAINSIGISYGAEVNFTTDKVAPTVTTQEATEVGQNQIKGNGNITATGGEDCSERGFEYGLTQTPTWSKKETVGGYGVGAFNLVIDGLEVNTTYWYRAYAVNSIGTSYGDWVQFQTAASGTIPTGAVLDICADYSGYTYQLHGAETDDGKTYESYFVLSTDLANKQGLHFNKRLEDLYMYFGKIAGSCKVYVKRDNEANWQYAGEVSMNGDGDIVVKHLPSDNEDTEGDVDFLAKHFLIKFVFENDFRFIGTITESIPGGER